MHSVFGCSKDKSMGFPGGASGKESPCQCRRHKRHRFDPWVQMMPWRRKWQLTPVFLPGKSQRQRSPLLYSPRGCRLGPCWGNLACTQAFQVCCSEYLAKLPKFSDEKPAWAVSWFWFLEDSAEWAINSFCPVIVIFHHRAQCTCGVNVLSQRGGKVWGQLATVRRRKGGIIQEPRKRKKHIVRLLLLSSPDLRTNWGFGIRGVVCAE